MKKTVLFTLLATSLIANAISLRKRDIPAVVKLPIQRNQAFDSIARDRQRRKIGKTVNQTIENAGTMYLCNISLGTPAQQLQLILDTGSSDIWCNSEASNPCSSKSTSCAESGAYNANSSSTYRYINSDFGISYSDGSSAKGDLVKDSLTVGGLTVPNLEFGVAHSSTSKEGVLGLGYMRNEAVIHSGHPGYANLPQSMVDNGLITSKAYSLWLDDLEANSGSILFGGVDTGKYIGKLETVPIIPVDGEYSQFLVNLTSLTININGGIQKTYTSPSLPAAAILDSGSTGTFLPDALVDSIYKVLNITYYSDEQTGYIPCKMMNENITLDFKFFTPTISVNIKELIIRQQSTDSGPACALGLYPAGQNTVVLGDTFLRSAYVVYDLDNNEISLANTNFNSTSSGPILEIDTTVSEAISVTSNALNPATTSTPNSTRSVFSETPTEMTTTAALSAVLLSGGMQSCKAVMFESSLKFILDIAFMAGLLAIL